MAVAVLEDTREQVVQVVQQIQVQAQQLPNMQAVPGAYPVANTCQVVVRAVLAGRHVPAIILVMLLQQEPEEQVVAVLLDSTDLWEAVVQV